MLMKQCFCRLQRSRAVRQSSQSPLVHAQCGTVHLPPQRRIGMGAVRAPPMVGDVGSVFGSGQQQPIVRIRPQHAEHVEFFLDEHLQLYLMTTKRSSSLSH